MTAGLFISIEGVEGAGKSTNLHFMQQYLSQQINLVTTREPGGTPLAESIRQLLLANHSEPVCAETEALLVFAARKQHVENLIKPALARGQWVISDRFMDATYAYQGAGRGLTDAKLDQLAHWSLGDFQPQQTLIFDLSVEQGMARVEQRGAKDRFEQEHWSFFEKIRQCYLARAAREPERYHVIDASRPLPDVQAELTQLMQGWLERYL